MLEQCLIAARSKRISLKAYFWDGLSSQLAGSQLADLGVCGSERIAPNTWLCAHLCCVCDRNTLPTNG